MDKNRAGYTNAVTLLDLIIERNGEILISEDMLSTIYYIIEEKVYALDFLDFIRQRWQIVPFGKEVVTQAIKEAAKKNLDLEDTLQCFCAKAYGCDVLVTNDKGFVSCGIPVMSVNELLNKMESEK
jgi:predicted nucleic acid-binding protein